jgi:hypothetical protein
MTSSDEFTTLDWIGVGLNAMAAAALFAFPFVVAPTFAGMFADFGAKSALPAITRVAMTPWPSLALGLMVSTLTAMVGVLRGADRIALRRGLVVVAFFVGAIGIVALLSAMYAPILDLAGKIKAE